MIFAFETRSYKESLVVSANIYLLISVKIGMWTVDEIKETFASKSSYIFDDHLEFNTIFSSYLTYHLQVSLEELLPYIQYSARCYWLDLKVEKSMKQNTAYNPQWTHLHKRFVDMRTLPHRHDPPFDIDINLKERSLTSNTA